MPNWCYNSLTLNHTDIEKINELGHILDNQEYENIKFFQILHPRPDSEEDNWYSWNVDNWGTKWDANISSHEFIRDESLTVNFDTAWSPPISFYQFIEEQGYVVSALYSEEGMSFCGKYEDGDDDYYDYSDYLDDIDQLREIPEDVFEFANLEYQHESHIEFLAEEDSEDQEEE